MTSHSSRIDHRGLGLISVVADTPDAQIAAGVLRMYHAAAGRQLLAAGVLARGADDAVTTSLVDHDDEPVPLVRSPDDGSHGYFSPNAGWVKVGPKQTALYRLDMSALLSRLTAQFDLAIRYGPTALIPHLLWEIGDMRLGRRAERVPVWFARRLSNQTVANLVADAAKARPALRTRILLTTTPSSHLKLPSASGQLVVDIRDVVDFADGIAVQPDILAARLDGTHPPDPSEPLNLSPDGKQLVILGGDPISFKSEIQIKILRTLVEGFKESKRYTADDLLSRAGSGVTTLQRAFGNAKWAQLSPFIKSTNGLWAFEF
jgi:hypothetical protein